MTARLTMMNADPGDTDNAQCRPDHETSWQCVRCTYVNEVSASNVCGMCNQFRTDEYQISVLEEEEHDPECRMILLGKTGAGKSSTGNTLLSKPAFVCEASPSSVTKSCILEKANRDGKSVHVVDTPGIFDIGTSNEEITHEIATWVRKSVPGPHAFILVTRMGRFTPEEKETFDAIVDIFGEDMYKYSIVLFTGKDDLDNEGKTLKEYIERSPPELSEILQKCKKRCIAFNNNATFDERYAMSLELLDMIDAMMKKNNGSCYTNALYSKAEHAMTERTRQTIEQCEIDRELPRWKQKSRRVHYENESQERAGCLESLSMQQTTGRTYKREIDQLKIEMLEMKLKQKSLECELAKAANGEEELKQQLREQQEITDRLRREDIDQNKDDSSWGGVLLNFVSTLKPVIVPLAQIMFSMLQSKK